MKGLTKEEVQSLRWKQIKRLQIRDSQEAYSVKCIYEGIEYNAIGIYYIGELEEIINIVPAIKENYSKFSKFYNDYLK